MDSTVLPVKDGENTLPVASSWRPIFQQVIESFVARDYRLSRGVSGVKPLDSAAAEQIESYIADYGATLTKLPEEAWNTSIAQWYGDHWEVLIDLWTEEEGASDMVLSARVKEVKGLPIIELHIVYVP